MKASLIAAAFTAAGLFAAASPAAAACSPGYERVQIQGHWLCKIKTPKLPLKAN